MRRVAPGAGACASAHTQRSAAQGGNKDFQAIFRGSPKLITTSLIPEIIIGA
jgi:hypothetical protein